jgi:hypothetical protein
MAGKALQPAEFLTACQAIGEPGTQSDPRGESAGLRRVRGAAGPS